MRGVQISYLIEHPEYVPQLAQWLFEQWDSILGEGTPEARIKKLKAHLNRDKLPTAWVAHANGQLLGTAALRVHDLEGREDLTPWLGGVFVGSHFRRQGIGAALCAAVEDEARSRAIPTMNLSDIFTNDSQKPLPKPNAVRRLSGDDGPWSPEHVRGIICNPCYAGVGPYPGLVPEAAWVHAAARTIHEDGPEQFLVN